LIRALREAGSRVPRDVSVIGFDGIALAEFWYPPLTTVAQPFHLIGQTLARLVLDQIQGQGQTQQERVTPPTELVIGGATAPPPPI
jgi:DNA-binding LacI/PurR family transcriptional regulator